MDDSMPRTRDHEALSDLVANDLLTVKEIAHATGLATNYIYEFLNHRRNPTPQMFNQMLVYAARVLPADATRFVAIANIVLPLICRDTPIECHIDFSNSLEGFSIEQAQRMVAALCESVGRSCGLGIGILADGKIDRSDNPQIAELKIKAPVLENHLRMIVRYFASELAKCEKGAA